jgi:hypothetical protein
METIEQIKQICLETNNEWFLGHDFPQVALFDLQLIEVLKEENILNFDERECVCNENKECIRCDIETDRRDALDKLKLCKSCNYIYDYNEHVYTKSKWIIPEKIDCEIPGFMLIKCCNGGFYEKNFTHELVFACVRQKYRKRGILKNMVSNIPKEWNIWLEANSNDIKNVENIWEKCGFSYYQTINKTQIIYKKCDF